MRIFGLGMMTRMKAQLLDTRIGNLTQDEFERNMKTLRILQKLVKIEAMVISSVSLLSIASPVVIYMYYIAVDDFAHGKITTFGIFFSVCLTAVSIVLITIVLKANNW